MAKSFFDIKNGIKLPGLASPPADPQEGDIYFDTTLSKHRKYTSGSWSDIGGGGGALPVVTSIDAMYEEIPVATAGTKIVTSSLSLDKNYALNAWAASGSMIAGRRQLCCSIGTVNSTLVIGGYTGAYTTACETFNGSSWSSSAALGVGASNCNSCGPLWAALRFGGYDGIASGIATTEKFNGTSWSATGSLIGARQAGGGAGVQSAALIAGGWNGATLTSSEKFNGAVWASTGALNTGRYYTTACGKNNAALQIGGEPAYTAAVEKFNGSTWSAVASLNTATGSLTAAGAVNNAFQFGGNPDGAERFNGFTWTTATATSISRPNCGSGGSGNAAIAFGGGLSGTATSEKFYGEIPFLPRMHVLTDDTELFETTDSETIIVGPAVIAVDMELDPLTSSDTAERQDLAEMLKSDQGDGIWTASGNMNLGRSYFGGAGMQNAALAFGNDLSSASAEKFNGTSWSNTGSLNTSRGRGPGAGSQNAAVAIGGSSAGSPITSCEKFNGSTWVFTGSISLAVSYHAACGAMNAALKTGGGVFSGGWTYYATCEKFDGSSWSATASMNSIKQGHCLSGSQNAAIVSCGISGTPINVTEKFNGNVWSITANPLLARYVLSSSGANNGMTIFGGYTTITLAIAEKFNGSIWALTGNLNTARYAAVGAGTQNSALAFGGNAGGADFVSTEKFSTQKALPYVGAIFGKVTVS